MRNNKPDCTERNTAFKFLGFGVCRAQSCKSNTEALLLVGSNVLWRRSLVHGHCTPRHTKALLEAELPVSQMIKIIYDTHNNKTIICTTANASYTVNIQTPLFQRVLGTIHLKQRAVF
jgi:hypothetical protein